MTTFHMETDAVRAMASQLKQAAETLRNQTQALNSSTQSVDWLGPSRDEFVMEAEAVIRQLNAQAEAGVVLSNRVNAEVNEWEQMDANSQAEYNRWLPLPAMTVTSFLAGFQKFFTQEARTKDLEQSISSSIDYIKNTDAGKDLEKLAQDNHVMFVLPNGTTFGDPNGTPPPIKIEIGETKETIVGGTTYGVYTTKDSKIVISSDFWEYYEKNKDPKQLASVLAHEMQHGVDDRQFDFSTPPITPEIENNKDKLEQYLSEVYTKSVETENRAFQRGDAILKNQPYTEDGQLSKSEAESILYSGKDQHNYQVTYEAHLNKTLKENNMNFTANVWVDPAGKVQVTLLPKKSLVDILIPKVQ